jgi:hypothetical protein
MACCYVMSGFSKPPQREEVDGTFGGTVESQVGGDLPHHRGEPEAVAREPAQQGDPAGVWMMVGDEVLVRSVGVETDLASGRLLADSGQAPTVMTTADGPFGFGLALTRTA